MGERHDPRDPIEQKRARMSRIAIEVSRRMTPEYARERARDMARERAETMREKALENSWLAPLIGASIGALFAKTLQTRAQGRSSDRFAERHGSGRRYSSPYYGYGRLEQEELGYVPEYEGDVGRQGSDLKERAAGAVGEAKERAAGVVDQASQTKDRVAAEVTDRASELKERVSTTADELKGRIQERTSALRERLPDRERIRASAQEDTATWALGALALGALFGFALPVSGREREMLGPARRKVREASEQAKELVAQKGSAILDEASARIEGRGGEHEQEPTPLH